MLLDLLPLLFSSASFCSEIVIASLATLDACVALRFLLNLVLCCAAPGCVYLPLTVFGCAWWNWFVFTEFAHHRIKDFDSSRVAYASRRPDCTCVFVFGALGKSSCTLYFLFPCKLLAKMYTRELVEMMDGCVHVFCLYQFETKL